MVVRQNCLYLDAVTENLNIHHTDLLWQITVQQIIILVILLTE